MHQGSHLARMLAAFAAVACAALPPPAARAAEPAVPEADADAGGGALSLDACLEIALRENLDIKYQEAVLARERYGVSSARSAFLPGLSAGLALDETQPDERAVSVGVSQASPWGMTLGASTTRTTGSTDAGTSVSMTLQQPLLRGAGTIEGLAALRKADLSMLATEARLSRKVQDVVYTVKAQYYDAARLTETVKVRRQAAERARRLLDEAAFKLSRGLVTVLDHANAVIQLADFQASLVSAEKQLEDAFDDLKETLNIPFDDPLAIVPMSLEVDQDVVVDEKAGTVAARTGDAGGGALTVIFRPVAREYESTVSRTMALRPDLRAAELDLDSRRIECRRRRSQLFHDLDLTATYTAWGAEDESPFDLTHGTWTGGVTMNWQLGRVAARAEYERALLDVELQEITVEKQRLGIRKEILRLFRRLEETEINILTYAQKINAAAQTLESAKIRKERGQSSYWEVTARESDLLNAQTSFINAYLDYQKRLAELDRACGGRFVLPPEGAAGATPDVPASARIPARIPVGPPVPGPEPRPEPLPGPQPAPGPGGDAVPGDVPPDA